MQIQSFKKNIILFCIFIFVFSSCKSDKSNIHGNCNNSFDPNTWDSCNSTTYKTGDFLIKKLNYDDLPYVQHKSTLNKKQFYDSDSVPLHQYQGRFNYHPVFIIQYALDMLDVYVTTQDSFYLTHLEKITDKLLGTSLQIDSAIFFPYSFDFPLHDCDEETMMAPWYSGMAQGQALSLFCRMYEFTNDEKYLNIGHKIFHSFNRLKGDKAYPWVSCVDKNGNLWLEEYPRDLPCFTLNGMIFSIYGIYDYYRVYPNETAEKILKAAITTIKDNIQKYRNENDVSWYCQKHHNFHGQNPTYHKIHIEQLNTLFKITGDSYFKDMASKFEQDTERK